MSENATRVKGPAENPSFGIRLFREQVVEARHARRLGGIVLGQSLSLWLLSLLTALCTATLVLFLIFGEYTRRTRVSGHLVPTRGIATVNAVTAGVLSAVSVKEGQVVQEGGMLAIVTVPQSTQHGDTVEALQRAIDNRLQSISQGYASQRNQLVAQEQGLAQQIENVRAELTQLEAELKTRRQQLSLGKKTTARLIELSKRQFITELQLQQQQAAELDQLGAVQNLERLRSSIRRQLAQLQQSHHELPSQLDTFAAAEQRDRSALQQETVQTNASAEAVLRAPLSGTIATLLGQPGQAVQAGQPVLNILPSDSLMEAHLLVPSRAVGFVEPGDAVLLRYQAFPYQKFGHQEGHVVRISRSALSAQEFAPFLGSMQAEEPYYRVVVALKEQTVRAFGQDEVLKAGMLLEADLLGERRKLWEWALEPLYALDGSIDST